MTGDDSKQTNHHDNVVDYHGFEKVLVLLQALRKSPSGAVLFRQIERLVRESESTQNRIVRGYASLVLTLIETYRRQLPRDSRLYLELMVVQRRLMPPISINELAALQVYLRNVANILGRVGNIDEEVLRDALAPLLEDSGGTIGLAPMSDRHETEDRKNHHQSYVEQQVTSAYRRRLDEQRQEMERMQKALADKVNEASQQQEGVGILLESILGKLKRINKVEDLDQVRQQLIREVDELVSAQKLLTGVLNDSQSLLTMVDDNSEQLRNELKQVRVLSLTDELTQLPNRRAFLRRLENEMERSQRDKSMLTLGMLDLDHFKQINDRYGHNVGDDILRTYTLEILSIFRRYDMVSRYGGEEFAILLPSTDRDGAVRAFNKVRSKAAETFSVSGGKELQVPSFSAGLAIYRPGESVQAFIDRADRALYRAKQSGRDRVFVDETYPIDKGANISEFGFDDSL